MSPEVLIIQVDIKANNERLVELTKQLNENKAAQKALADANKAGTLSADELAAGQVRLKTSAAAIAQETRILTKANADQDKANKASAGSIAQLRAELASNTAAYNALSKAERDNSAAGQKLQADTKAISAELKRLEGAIGDNRRNVGGYKDAILEAGKEMGLFGGKVGEVGGVLSKFKSGSDLVKQGLGMLKGAGETGSLGFKAIAGGIALTGIGLFVIAISAVVAYFTQSAEGGRQLASILGGLGGVLQVATDLVTGFGRTLVSAFTNPMESLKKFGEAVGKFLSDPIGFARSLGDSIGNVATQFKAAYVAGGEFAKREREIAALRRQDAIDDTKEQTRIEVLLRLSKERGKAAAEQLASLKEAGRLQRELTEGDIALALQELALVQDKIKNAGAGKNQELIERKDALRLEITQAVAARDEMNAKIKVRESVFRQEQRTEAAAAAKAAREDAVKAKQTEVEGLLLTVQKGSAAELVLLQRQIRLAADLALAAGTQTAAEKLFILAKAEGDIAQLQAEFNAKALENAKKHDAATVAEANREYTEALAALENYLNQKRAAVEADFASGLIGETEYKKQLNAIERAGNAAALVNAKDYGRDTGAIQKKAADAELARLNLLKDEKKRIAGAENDIKQASLQAATIVTDAIISAFGQETAAGQAALVIKKTLALAEIAINLQRQLSANAFYASTLGPLGPPYLIATNALAIAGALAGAAKIAGFKQGGYVSGPGTGTSDSIPARLSNGESVMNANTTAMFTPLLSMLNVAGGGVAFASGGLAGQRSPAPLNDGGLLARLAGAAAPAIDYNQLAAAMTRVNLEVGVSTLRRGEARYDAPRRASTLG